MPPPALSLQLSCYMGNVFGKCLITNAKISKCNARANMRGSRKFCQGGPFCFFKLMRGAKDPNTTISGPSSDRQGNAIKWRFAGVPMMAQH